MRQGGQCGEPASRGREGWGQGKGGARDVGAIAINTVLTLLSVSNKIKPQFYQT